MADSVSKPLTMANLTQINEQLAEMQRLKLDIERAQMARVPLDGHAEQCADCQQRWELLKKAYFPGQP